MKRTNALWLQCGACGGCSMSMLGYDGANMLDTFKDVGIDFLWHPVFSELSGTSVIETLDDILTGKTQLDLLIIEGTPLLGPNGTGRYQMLSGSDKPMAQWIFELAAKTQYCLAVGSCATYGGIPMAGDDRLEATGLQYHTDQIGGLLGSEYLSGAGFPVINIPGCAPHPDWIVETLSCVATDALRAEDIDPEGRPLAYFGHLAHHGCPRNEYYEFKASAATDTDQGCLMENLGCKGTQALGDCNIRPWNGNGSCLQGSYTCIACTMPGFEDTGSPFLETAKVAGIPVGLPSDMPKAWFVALAALSKSATPERVRENAHASKIVHQPTRKKAKN
ncbi:HupU protein [Terasakiella sp. A23]|uniref:NADH-quinone oxidoreductase subunit B family protein n=1 Tax=Terasakiella sp. FCG-A23 TaxID=3080561 RepID=UPI002952E3E5|nr:HupU protein [Terasakiella sp. A23]MDV7338308.1 HupU protein [Terasakiella sp. A23]